MPSCDSLERNPLIVYRKGKSFAQKLQKVIKQILNLQKEQRLEAAQMKFLRHLLGIKKLDKENNQCIRQKKGSTEHSKGNKTVLGKVATTCTEDGHKEITKTSTTK